LVSEEETRMLLRIRDDLERRIGRLQVEIADLRKAVAEIDKLIVRHGFRQPTVKTEEEREEERGSISVKAKDGTVLGMLQIDEKEIVFVPQGDIAFTTALPPFQSFLIDRVLANMRSTDENRATQGEVSAEDVLDYDVSADGDRLLKLVVRNYGGERRLREIRSSLRWTFDKMYETLKS